MCYFNECVIWADTVFFRVLHYLWMTKSCLITNANEMKKKRETNKPKFSCVTLFVNAPIQQFIIIIIRVVGFLLYLLFFFLFIFFFVCCWKRSATYFIKSMWPFNCVIPQTKIWRKKTVSCFIWYVTHSNLTVHTFLHFKFRLLGFILFVNGAHD